MYEWETTHESLRIMEGILSITRTVNESYHVYGSFGDVYIQIAVIKEKYQVDHFQNPNIKICIFISPNFEQIVTSTFPGDPNVRLCPVDNAVLNMVFNNLKLLGRHKNFPIRLLTTLYPVMAELMLDGKILYLDFLRKLVGSPHSGPITPIESFTHLSEAHKILSENNVAIGRTVLICADNNSHAEFPEDIWIEIIKMVQSCGWDVCINDSGTLVNKEAKNLRIFGIANDIKFIKIPPHLPISMTRLMGSYISGSNGFVTIQAYMGGDTVGMHLINCLESPDGHVKMPGGYYLPLDVIYSKNWCGGCDHGLQIEVPISSNRDLFSINTKINSMLLDP